MKIVKRTHTFSLPISEVFGWYKLKSEYDPYDDTYHGGHSEAAVQSFGVEIPEEAGGDKLMKYFPGVAARALEEAERYAIVEAMDKAAADAVESNLMAIDVPGEYTGLNDRGEQVDVSQRAYVSEVRIERPEEKVYITIVNPEHLINDLINGEGCFYPMEILVDQAQNEAVQSRLHFLSKYQEIYGEPVRGIPDRLEPAALSDDSLREALLAYAGDVDGEEVVERALELAQSGEAKFMEVIDFASKFIPGLSRDTLKAQAKRNLKDMMGGSYDKFINPRMHPVWNFDRWFDEADSECYFADYESWGLDKEKIEQEYRDATGLKPSGSLFEKYEIDIFRKKAWIYVQERLLELDEEFSRIESKSGKVKLYRHLIVKDGKDFIESLKSGGVGSSSRKGIGECWSWDKDSAYSHCSEIAEGSGCHVMLTGLARWEDVDMDSTVWNNFNPNWAHEREIKLNMESIVEVLRVEIDGEAFDLNVELPT